MAKEEFNGYELSRDWFDWCFVNTDKVNTHHTALYFFIIEHCNRMGWKKNFGLPMEHAKEALGIKNYKTYSKTFEDLVNFGFIEVIQRSKNQYTATVIALVKNTKVKSKALDKALSKQSEKQELKQVQGTVGIDKPLNLKTTEPLNLKTNDEPDGSYQKFIDIYSDWYEKRVGVKIMFDGIQGKALKKIIKYLTDNSKEKSAKGGADGWEYILANWDKLDNFHQEQVKVSQIQSNLPNILNKLKNGTKLSKSESLERASQEAGRESADIFAKFDSEREGSN